MDRETVEVICALCGSKKLIYKSRAKSKRYFCTNQCRYAYDRSQVRKGVEEMRVKHRTTPRENGRFRQR